MSNYFAQPYFQKTFWKNKFFQDNDFFKLPFFEGLTAPAPTNPVIPSKPTGIQVQGVTQTELELSWVPSAHANRYNVAISPAVTGYPKDVSVPNDSVTGLTAGQSYTIKIKACSPDGCSAVTSKSATTAS